MPLAPKDKVSRTGHSAPGSRPIALDETPAGARLVHGHLDADDCQGFLVFELTDSAGYLGLVGFAAGAPSLLLVLHGGVVSDRISQRSVLMVTQTSMMALAFILAGLTFAGSEPWPSRPSTVAFSFVRWGPRAFLAMVGTAWGMMVPFNMMKSILLGEAEDGLRGGVMPFYTLSTAGLVPVGALVTGAAAARFGEPQTVQSSGAFLLGFAVVLWLRTPGIRGLG
ncbi:MAG: hypothetical protein ABSB61_09135 [Anaerolineales bacterium]